MRDLEKKKRDEQEGISDPLLHEPPRPKIVNRDS